METQVVDFIGLLKNPFENSKLLVEKSTNRTCISNEKEAKWRKFSFFAKVLIFSQILLTTSLIQPVSSQQWDGIVITEADLQGLQAFKQELIDPKSFLKSWNDTGLTACSGGWTGIKCAKGQVIVIQLPWKGLGGRITSKIGQFQSLRKLSLHDNQIGGSIPIQLGFLPNLRGLQLFNNRFSGLVPPTLGLSPSLQNIDLSNNELYGTIPGSLANSTKLYRLNLSFNSFSGLIPVSLLTHSYSLEFLDIQHNNVSGSIPSSIGMIFRLRTLDFSYNALNGELPVSLLNLSSLVVLNLEGNKFSAGIPESIDRMHNLSVLNLKKNQFNGEIPKSLGNMSTLTKLDISENEFSGEIPDSIGDLKSLKLFNVSYNNLSGSVPAVLSQKFKSSSFEGNALLCGYSDLTKCPSINLPPKEARKPRKRKLSTKDIILIAAGALLLVMLILVCLLFCCLLRKKSSRAKNGEGEAAARTSRAEKGVEQVGGEVEAGGEAGGKLVHFDGPMVFTADDLLCATAEIMGKSTYGTVYKATLEDGSQVAVKRLREKITKGRKEFESEVNLIGKIRHPNLLALRAYYLGPKGEKLLVFDYMSQGSLATFLHARGPETPVDWPTRMKIAKGMTRGLYHLHTAENIIHGNLTSSNVLLDSHTDPKIADYGLSRLMSAAASSSVIATASALGYRAPELSKMKKANTKTDVYSLGVIILELLTGKSPSEAMNGVDLPNWVASIVKEEWTNEVFDVELMKDGSINGDELLNTLKLALHCVDPSASARPEVLQVLEQLEVIRPEMMAAGPSSVASASE